MDQTKIRSQLKAKPILSNKMHYTKYTQTLRANKQTKQRKNCVKCKERKISDLHPSIHPSSDSNR
ncbi:hypothetical protein DERP_002278 [Dermatophagoides pteronyssinus]|uniref:Uncharacterized protein n=1 Tax=Dermatophagoides pteronyssinus TaxID=6956 RepID=A0ABQ8JHA9_DERPT|nr:hypothetical protein DERP_002278 [Dermatophagoides pteronyssinus]